MINREIIRTKIVQLTYAYYQNGTKDLNAAEKELFFSIDKAYELYHTLLRLITAITREGRKHVEVAQARAEREGTAAPSTRFIDNLFALQVESNIELANAQKDEGDLWEQETDFIRKLYLQIVASGIYRDYMAAEGTDYAADRELWRVIYRRIIQNNEDLEKVLEDHSLYWNDDKEVVDTFVLKTIKRFTQSEGAQQALLPEFDAEEDREFARTLFRATILNSAEYQRYMGEASRNWDFRRLAYMDVVIMQIAIAEMMTFPTIPISVSINEFVDIAKLYSTPKSAGYVNGMLDAIARHLVRTGRLKKAIVEKNDNTIITDNNNEQ